MLAGSRPVLGFSSAAGSAAQGFVLEDQLLAAEKIQGFLSNSLQTSEYSADDVLG